MLVIQSVMDMGLQSDSSRHRVLDTFGYVKMLVRSEALRQKRWHTAAWWLHACCNPHC